MRSLLIYFWLFAALPSFAAERGKFLEKSNFLSLVGGPFERVLPRFKGFQQVSSKHCWAAVIQTLFYHQTGVEISQWELSRLQFETFEKDGVNMVRLSKKVLPKGHCDGFWARNGECQRSGSATLVLNHLGLQSKEVRDGYLSTLPLTRTPDEAYNDYDEPSKMAVWFRTLRNALEKGMPVALSLFGLPGEGDGHGLVLYGAKFWQDGYTRFHFRLWVYDPDNDTHFTMEDDLSYYGCSNCRRKFWRGYMDAIDPASISGPGKAFCEFLAPADQTKLCPEN
jgi:hypothetical protein